MNEPMFIARRDSRGARWRVTVLALAAICLAGCGKERIDVEYGQRGGDGAKSVNGTSVLADMFASAGHRVRSWNRLSPTVQEADVIVWFPDNFQGPGEKTREWLDNWLAEQPRRKLIYVGRDYDAEPAYWQAIAPLAPPEQATEVGVRLKNAQTRVGNQRKAQPASQDVEWFTIDGQHKSRPVRTLDGSWSDGIDPQRVEIELHGLLTTPDGATVLLESSGDAIATRQAFDDGGELIVVTNGSFLLNYSLINHEHRKLAGKLIDEIGPPRQTVFFLESAYGDPPIVAAEPEAETPTGLEFFHVWPLNYVLLHLAVLGVIFMLARWPIFGVPKTLPAPPSSDFGQHVLALGTLLKQTRDRAFALARIRHYQQVAGLETAPPPIVQTPLGGSEAKGDQD